MRLRTFTAPSITEAMRQVREALGEDAIILSTEQQGRTVTLTAAIDPAHLGAAPVRPRNGVAVDPADAIASALHYHGVPVDLAQRLLAATSGLGVGDAQQTLTAALRSRFAFQSLTERAPANPILLAGLPGAGKSSTLAKLAAQAKAHKWPIVAITCDLAKAGAVEQLATYAKALEIQAFRAKDAATLQRAVARAEKGAMVLIDTIGTNPLVPADLKQLRELIAAVSADPVLVMAAGGDVSESTELAAAYAEAGCRRLIATKLDVARRYGGILAAADAGKLSFAGFGTSPEIATGLAAPRADRLCRLFLPEASTSQKDGPTPTDNGTQRATTRPHSKAPAKSPGKPLSGAAS
ncbi:MAG TPA: GTPase [Dongiaceae bacterium]|nr:GTPase [Dongiaceae bacterium]